MKGKGYCKVASAILGTTVLTVPELPRSVAGAEYEALGSRRGSADKSVDDLFEIRSGEFFLMPKAGAQGVRTVADLQFSFLFTSGDSILKVAITELEA